jgi:DNA-binding GntR family transcriptional regulator
VEAARNAQQHIFMTMAANLASIASHDWILKALEQGDVEQAAQRVAEHLQPVFSYRARTTPFRSIS